ncbi:hypothetical protein D3C77_409020 [compost metagenome]
MVEAGFSQSIVMREFAWLDSDFASTDCESIAGVANSRLHPGSQATSSDMSNACEGFILFAFVEVHNHRVI